jgi:4,5-dihydroxyphthalate decarboxylase
MPNDKITLACRNYDRTQAIIRGLVKADGFDLQVTEMTDVPKMFTAFFRGEYDASEMSLAELVYYTSRGQNDFIGIPVFPSKMFRHSFIFCNGSSGIRSPADLEGKKIAFPRLVQTACIWIRGTLVKEYQISAKNTGWYATALHHWDAKEEVQPRDGSTVHWLEKRGKDDNETVESALLEGKIDALGTAQIPSPFIQGDRRIKRLFENYREEEASYFTKTKIFPIMHTLAVRKSAVEKHPDLPRELFRVFARSRRWAKEWLQMDPSLQIVWKNHYLNQERELFKEDPWAYGLEKNAHVINKFLSYCYDLGLSEKALTPRELFHPSTWDLAEAEE